MPFAERVLYEDDDLLVLDKPAGWLMHSDRPEEPTLLAHALEYLRQSGFTSDCTPAFVHRLDKETTGVAVLAKTKEAVRSLNRQLKFKKIHKEYVALVVGEIRPQGSIRLSLQKQMDRKRWLALMVPVRRGGIFAQTDYKRLELFEWAPSPPSPLPTEGEGVEMRGVRKLSYVAAYPRTGRTHQVRAHFAAVGCPIVGDDLYGNAELNERLRQELGVSRMLLHAAAIEFLHPTTNQRVRVEATLPQDFQDVLQRLRRS
jgi:23S rRNA-/tRNA-specific pseudouridylate synthase